MGEAAQHPGTTHAHVWLRRAAATFAGAVVLTGVVRLPAATAAPAPASASPSGSSAATVAIDSMTPAVAGKGGTLKITGTVTNDSSETITGGHVGVHVAPDGPLGSRSDIGTTPATGNFNDYTDGAEVPGHTAGLPSIAPHVSRPFTLDMPVKSLGLTATGVYALGVSASGSTKAADFGHVVGIDRTYLPWNGPDSGKKLDTTYLWPLIDRPHMDIRTPGGDDEEAPLFRDDDLAAELAPGGRLEQLVTLGRKLPVTWVIDPDLLASVDAMTKPYKVVVHQGNTTRTVNGTGTQYARQWLNELQTAVQSGTQVVALPFGDPDIASIAHNGKNVPGTIAHLQSATEMATTTVQTILGVVPRTDFAWPVDGAVDQSVVSTAAAGGADEIIARSDSLAENGRLPYTPTAERPIGGGDTAIVADAALSTAFSGAISTAAQSTTAIQRFLAQSMAIRDQQPQLQRSIVVAPQRMPSATQAQAMAEAIHDATAGGWTKAIPLGDAATAAADSGADRSVPSAHSYPRSLRRQEISTAAFRQIQSVQDSLNSFLDVLSRKDRVVTPFGNAILSSMSTEWRGDRGPAGSFRDDIAAYLSDLTGDVHIIKKESITLSGRSATIPVTVQNSLNQQVSGLELRLVSNQSNRLNPGLAQTVDIDGGHSRSLRFQTTARANGKAQVTAQLYTKDGTPYGRPMQFQVNVTSITDTVMLVIAVGLLLLVLAGIRMYHQRKRNALLAGADPDEAGEEAVAEADGTADEAGQDTVAGPAEDAPAPQDDPVPANASDAAETDSADTGVPADGRAGAEGEEPAAPCVPAARDGEDSGARPAAPTVPGQPGDPAQDTSAEGAEPPAPGEKVER
ncbi:DUF6049 family protein [Streptomyces sp. SL13]|uniref:DUF6049 family protein n=1 Tax=Streptantibioticus silvisoli TaxID=2705255 RepID=A0AA90H3C1_9ACTN|nr:DUF6049 family protein [Streptantibioticus silvisoli]MDI5961913.1 DUF6049 family protein [Streptantibioticus silvisoli]MDI5970546.1 DUF6049 family protein [Streptantibioticus silvisoli]